MKRLSVLFVCFYLCMHQVLLAQEDSEFRFTVKTNPLSALGGPLFVAFIPITGEYKILFEARTTKKQSIEAGIGYLGPSLLLNLDELSENDSVSGVKTSGYRVQLAYKFFLTKEVAPEGFYIGPHLSYAKARIKDKENPEDSFSASKANINVIFGYQLITKGGFALNVFSGLGLKIRDYSFNDDSIFEFDYNDDLAPNVAFGFTFGYAF